MLSRLITRAVGWAAGKFYELDLRGDSVPAGPVLVVANHPNALLDPLIVFRVAGRVVGPLAKEPLFRHPLVGPVLRTLGGLPVYRRQDNPALMHQNEQTFAAAVQALHAGKAVQIYPEGQSHSEVHLTPLKTGAARIAFLAEQQADWQLGLQITPIGLTYARKTFYRGRAVAQVGASFGIADRRADYEADPEAAVRALTAEITRRIEALTLILSEREDALLIDTAERLYAREKGVTGWRDADRLGDRLPRMQAFAQALAWLRDNDPARHKRLAHSVKHYRRQVELLGAGEGDVPPRYEWYGVAWYVLREAFMLGIGLPLALVGLIFWYPPYALNRAIVNRLNVEETGIATHKLGLAMLLMPLMLLIWVALAYFAFGAVTALIAVVVLPLLGLVLHRWSRRWQKVKQDSALFLRLVTRPRQLDRLADQRRELVHEFDDVRALLGA